MLPCPSLPVSFCIAQGFPSHTSSLFCCHFYFTKLREDSGLGKERNQNKNRTVGRNAKTEMAVLGILWDFFVNGKAFRFETKLPLFFLLANTRGSKCCFLSKIHQYQLNYLGRLTRCNSCIWTTEHDHNLI